jgi:hypothetical protein
MKHLMTYEKFNVEVEVEVEINPKEYEYQFRDIDAGIWYRRKKGTEVWSFTTEEDFNKHATKDNTIEWEDK